MNDYVTIALLIFAGFGAGALNALAGGGPLITLAALLLTGLDARAANMTSTVALFPGQIATGLASRALLSKANVIPVAMLVAINIVGGMIGAALLLTTPSAIFAVMVPWLVMIATAIYAWSSFGAQPIGGSRIGSMPFAVTQFLLSIYGGYFGGGNSFLMLALLSVAGLAARDAGGLKNLLIAIINTAAVGVLIFSPSVDFTKVILLGAGAIVGGMAGVWMLGRINETLLRLFVISVGTALTLWLFWVS